MEIKKITKLESGRIKVQSMPVGESMTQRQFQEDTDVNKIMQKYKKLGQITHLNSRSGVYADITELGDYQQAMETVIRADRAFNDLPSNVRARFANDPQRLIEFLSDPKNEKEGMELGLIVQKEPEAAPQPPAKPI